MTELDKESQLRQLESLVDELMKEEPQEDVVKEKMESSGLTYTQDPIERIHYVLKALHFSGESESRESW